MVKIIYYIFQFFLKEIWELIKKVKDIFLYEINSIFSKNSKFNFYIKENEKFWKNNHPSKKTDKKILITDFVSHEGYTIQTNVIGKYITNIENLEPIGLIRKYDIRGTKIFRSYGIKNIFILNYGSLAKKFLFFIKSIKILRKFENVDQLIKYKEGNINIGLCVYDHILRNTGIGSTNKITFKFYYFLSIALNTNEFCKNFFLENKIALLVQGEKQYLPSSIVFQNALSQNCSVYTYDGLENYTVVSYSNILDTYRSKTILSKEIFQYLCDNFKDEVLSEGKKLLDKRFLKSDLYSKQELNNPSQNLDHYILSGEKDFKRGIKFSKRELCNFYKWDINKPIVGVFASDFYDGNFECSWLLFKDNLTWLRSTLKHIKNISNVNWLVKEHPTIYKINEIASTKIEYKKIIDNCEHVKLFDEKYSPSSLLNCLEVAVSCASSVGLEYPCFGIPSIITGESYFGGFGFTNEPRTKEEYFSYLNNINDLEALKLSKDQIEKAIIYYYACRVLTRVKIPLLPFHDITRNIDSEKFWNDLTKLLRNYDLEKDYFFEMLKKQFKEKSRHTVDYKQLKSIII